MSGMQLGNLVDARLIGRPPVFDGAKPEEFNDWPFQVKCYLSVVLEPSLTTALDRSANSESAVPMEEDTERRRVSSQVYVMLVSLLRGSPLNMLKQVGDQWNGGLEDAVSPVRWQCWLAVKESVEAHPRPEAHGGQP